MVWAESSDAVQIVGMVMNLLGMVLTAAIGAVVTYFLAKMKAQATEDAAKAQDSAGKAEDAARAAAQKTGEVKRALMVATDSTAEQLAAQGEKLDTGLKIQRATHRLVNKETSEKLHKIRDKSKRIYDLEQTPANLEELQDAERALATHMEQQAAVDREYGVTAAAEMGTRTASEMKDTKDEPPPVTPGAVEKMEKKVVKKIKDAKDAVIDKIEETGGGSKS